MNNDTNSNPFDDSNLSPIDASDSSGRPFVWLILGVAALGCCVLFAAAFFLFQPDAKSLVDKYFPSLTPTFTRTPTPTPTPNLTATQQVIQSIATARAIQTTVANAGSQWSILFSDTFDTNENNWDIGLDKGERAKINRTILNGKYQWEATSIKGFVAWLDADTKSLDNFSLTVDVQQTSGSPSSDYGLIFREDANNNFYYFGIDNDSYQVSVSYNDKWIDVIDWTTSSAIRSDGPNRLTVIAEGSHFIFLINDQYVADATDDHIARETVALAITLHDADQQATFEFDNIELRAPAPPANLTATQHALNVVNTAQALQSTASEWEVVLEDNFDSNKNGWGTESKDDEQVKSIITVANGKYSWDITPHDLEITWEAANTRSLGDFIMSVDAKQISGFDTAKYGIFFRENSAYYGYYFGLTNKGEYYLDLYNGEWITLIDYTKSKLIMPNEYNRLTVIAEGSHFTFFINDQYVAEYTDEHIKNGDVGLFSLLYEPDQQTVFEFDNILLKVPK